MVWNMGSSTSIIITGHVTKWAKILLGEFAKIENHMLIYTHSDSLEL